MLQRPRASREPFPEWASTLLAFLLASFVVAVLSACADDSVTPPAPNAPAAVAGSNGATISRQFIPNGWIATVPDGTEVAVVEALRRSPGVAFAD
jgi:hypothetical protein